MTLTQLTAFLGASSAFLGLLGYILRIAVRGLRAIDGHLDAMRANTLETKRLSQRMDRMEAIVTKTGWRAS